MQRDLTEVFPKRTLRYWIKTTKQPKASLEPIGFEDKPTSAEISSFLIRTDKAT